MYAETGGAWLLCFGHTGDGYSVTNNSRVTKSPFCLANARLSVDQSQTFVTIFCANASHFISLYLIV